MPGRIMRGVFFGMFAKLLRDRWNDRYFTDPELLWVRADEFYDTLAHLSKEDAEKWIEEKEIYVNYYLWPGNGQTPSIAFAEGKGILQKFPEIRKYIFMDSSGNASLFVPRTLKAFESPQSAEDLVVYFLSRHHFHGPKGGKCKRCLQNK